MIDLREIAAGRYLVDTRGLAIPCSIGADTRIVAWPPLNCLALTTNGLPAEVESRLLMPRGGKVIHRNMPARLTVAFPIARLDDVAALVRADPVPHQRKRA